MDFIGQMVSFKVNQLRNQISYQKDCLKNNDKEKFVAAIETFERTITIDRDFLIKTANDFPKYRPILAIFESIDIYQKNCKALLSNFIQMSFQNTFNIQNELIKGFDGIMDIINKGY